MMPQWHTHCYAERLYREAFKRQDPKRQRKRCQRVTWMMCSRGLAAEKERLKCCMAIIVNDFFKTVG